MLSKQEGGQGVSESTGFGSNKTQINADSKEIPTGQTVYSLMGKGGYSMLKLSTDCNKLAHKTPQTLILGPYGGYSSAACPECTGFYQTYDNDTYTLTNLNSRKIFSQQLEEHIINYCEWQALYFAKYLIDLPMMEPWGS